MPGGQDGPGAGVYQQNQAGRDVYAAGGDQTVINDNRRVELAAGAVPHPAAVGLAGLVAGLPRRPVRVFEGRDEALTTLERVLGVRGGAVVTQAVYGLGGCSRPFKVSMKVPLAVSAGWCEEPRRAGCRAGFWWPGWRGGGQSVAVSSAIAVRAADSSAMVLPAV